MENQHRKITGYRELSQLATVRLEKFAPADSFMSRGKKQKLNSSRPAINRRGVT